MLRIILVLPAASPFFPTRFSPPSVSANCREWAQQTLVKSAAAGAAIIEAVTSTCPSELQRLLCLSERGAHTDPRTSFFLLSSVAFHSFSVVQFDRGDQIRYERVRYLRPKPIHEREISLSSPLPYHPTFLSPVPAPPCMLGFTVIWFANISIGQVTFTPHRVQQLHTAVGSARAPSRSRLIIDHFLHLIPSLCS